MAAYGIYLLLAVAKPTSRKVVGRTNKQKKSLLANAKQRLSAVNWTYKCMNYAQFQTVNPIKTLLAHNQLDQCLLVSGHQYLELRRLLCGSLTRLNFGTVCAEAHGKSSVRTLQRQKLLVVLLSFPCSIIMLKQNLFVAN